MYIIFKLSDDNLEGENGMVTIVVAVDEELLRRMDASLQPDLAAEGITRDRVEVGKDQQSGELHFKSNVNQSYS